MGYVSSLASQRDFEPFAKPVPRSTPDYYRLVKKPMDLATIQSESGTWVKSGVCNLGGSLAWHGVSSQQRL